MSCGREYYDENSNVCSNQNDFNMAFRKAIRYNEKQDVKKMGSWAVLYVIIWVVFFVWAIMLALKVDEPSQRVAHITFAMVFGPIYVIAYYVSNMQQ